jgi:hypothetical protein
VPAVVGLCAWVHTCVGAYVRGCIRACACTHLVGRAEQQARVVPPAWASVLGKRRIDIDVGDHTVPVGVVGADSPAVTERLALRGVPLAPSAKAEENGSSRLVESITHLAILLEGCSLITWCIAAVFFLGGEGTPRH